MPAAPGRPPRRRVVARASQAGRRASRPRRAPSRCTDDRQPPRLRRRRRRRSGARVVPRAWPPAGSAFGRPRRLRGSLRAASPPRAGRAPRPARGTRSPCRRARAAVRVGSGHRRRGGRSLLLLVFLVPALLAVLVGLVLSVLLGLVLVAFWLRLAAGRCPPGEVVGRREQRLLVAGGKAPYGRDHVPAEARRCVAGSAAAGREL